MLSSTFSILIYHLYEGYTNYNTIAEETIRFPTDRYKNIGASMKSDNTVVVKPKLVSRPVLKNSAQSRINIIHAT